MRERTLRQPYADPHARAISRRGPAGDYRKIRAQFASSHWPDLRTAGNAYADLAIQLRHARYTDGYQTVWFYQRLSAACTKHGQARNART